MESNETVNTEVATATPTAPKETKKITLTTLGLMADLKSGLDRKGIAKKYGITQAEVTRQFKNPKLKGLRVNRPSGQAGTIVELIDDAPEVAPKVKKEKKAVSTDNVSEEATGEAVQSAAVEATAPLAPAPEVVEEAPASPANDVASW